MKGSAQSRKRREDTAANEQHAFGAVRFLGGSHVLGKAGLLLNQSLVGAQRGRFQTEGQVRCGKDIK